MKLQLQNQAQKPPKTPPEPKVGAPEHFHGDTSANLRAFVAVCENTFAMQPSIYGTAQSNTYNSQARVGFAASYLKGAAMQWWISMINTNPAPEATTRWSAFKAALAAQFEEPQRVRFDNPLQGL